MSFDIEKLRLPPTEPIWGGGRARYRGMSIDEHREYGKIVKQFREATMALLGRFPKTSDGGKAVAALIKSLDYNKARLEDAMYEQHKLFAPKDFHVTGASVYYGPKEK